MSYACYKDILIALLNISSIIFAIIGAWIAIIYPRSMGRVFNAKNVSDNVFKEADSDANYLSQLIEIIMVSAIVLMMVLSIQFSVPIVKNIIPVSIKPFAKYSAFFVIFLLTLSQLYAIFRVILANYFFLNSLRKTNIDAKIDALHK